jgi:hypothetical protein
MGDRWGPDGPPEDAYSRVTGPERFAVVVEAADALVADLLAAYDVVAEPVPAGADGVVAIPFGNEGVVRAVRLTPREGAPLTIAVTDFPGVRLRRGHWDGDALPRCGCDACDETGEECAAELREWVAETVAGQFTETLSRRPRRLAVVRPGRSEWSSLDRAELATLATVAPPGTYRWAAWPARDR